MMDYVKRMLDEFPMKFEKEHTALTPAANDLFEDGKGQKLDKKQEGGIGILGTKTTQKVHGWLNSLSQFSLYTVATENHAAGNKQDWCVGAQVFRRHDGPILPVLCR